MEELSGLSPAAIIEQLHRNDVTHVVWLPDSETNFMYEQMAADESIDIVAICREGESLGIAAGLWVGGKKPVVMIQNTGLFESGDSIRGLGNDIEIPLVLIIGYGAGRGTESQTTRQRGSRSRPSTPGASTTTWWRRTPTPTVFRRRSRRPSARSVPWRA